MAKLPGKCIFCEGFRLSREHVFGEWLKEFFPRDKTTTHTMGTFTWSDEIITRGPSKTSQNKPGHTGTRKVRVVCQTCNNGWLSVLEDQTKPVLTPLITGKHANLTPEAQTILATWASKTVMTAEYVQPKGRCVTQKERVWLKARLTPPEDWCVWIAAYNGSEWHNLTIYQHRGYLHESPIPSPGDKARHIQSTFFGVGRIVFLVVNSAMSNIRFAFSAIEEVTGLIQIWPAQKRSVIWPTIRIFNDEQATAAAHVLRRSGIFGIPPRR